MSKRMSESAKKRPPISETTRKKMSEAHKGKQNSFYGETHSQSSKKKISEAKKGQKHSEATKKKMSESAKKRPPISETTRKKMSELSKRENLSDITRKKMSESKKLQIFSEATKKKISKTLTGRIVPESTRKKLSESLTGRISPMKGRIPSKLHKKRISKANSTPKNKQKSRERLRNTRHNQVKPNNQELKIKKILIDASMDFNIHFDMHVNIPLNTTQIEQNSKEVDFLILPNKIIEFNGTYPHADPRKYKPDDKIWSKIAKNIWKKESIVLEQLRKQDFKILVVWEMDLMKDFEKTTKKILRFAKA